MNTVSVTGTLTEDPELRADAAGEPECRMRVAVPRYSRGGLREPGVVYLDASVSGLRARDCAERLSEGSRVGLAGRLHGAGVLIDQLDYL